MICDPRFPPFVFYNRPMQLMYARHAASMAFVELMDEVDAAKGATDGEE